MILYFDHISKSYGSNLALNNFTISIHPGIYALLGPNGSGKSTLMNILTDNLKADSGEITYTDDTGNTENVLHMDVRFREKLGFMPQYPGLYPNFTVERFMWYMAALKGIKKENAKKQIPEILGLSPKFCVNSVKRYKNKRMISGRQRSDPLSSCLQDSAGRSGCQGRLAAPLGP